MSSIASQLERIQLRLFQYEVPFIFALGIVGNFASIITFARRTLRKNVCSWYFISLSLAHLVLLLCVCLPRIISATTGYDFARYSIVFCKIRAYATDSSLTLARHFLCLISIDRWLVTSSHINIRNQSSTRVARQMIIGSFFLWITFNTHTIIKYEITALGCSPPLGGSYELFYSMCNIVISIVPMFIMSFFTVLAVRNLRARMNHRIQPVPQSSSSRTNPGTTSTQTTNQLIHHKRRDGQLIRLSIIQVAAFLILNTIRAIFPLYSFLVNSGGPLSPDQRSLSIFISGIGNNLVYTYTAVCIISSIET